MRAAERDRGRGRKPPAPYPGLDALRDRVRSDGPVPEGAKRCAHKACRRVKPLAEFSADRNRPDGKQPWCKSCTRAAMSEWRRTEAARAGARAYSARPEVKARRAAALAADPARAARAEAQTAAYRATPRARLLNARRKYRCYLRNATDPVRREFYAARVLAYDAAVLALDQDPAGPVAPVLTFCPGCGISKPSETCFRPEYDTPGGRRSPLCRTCAPPVDRAARHRAQQRHYRRSTRYRILDCLQSARRRLARAKDDRARARIGRTIALYHAELARIDARTSPDGGAGGAPC